MRILEISTVVGCRLNCEGYCPQKAHVRAYYERVDSSSQFAMTLDDFKRVLSAVPNSVEIMFAGMAEPFLNSHCVKMIRHAWARGHTISVFSTLAGLDPIDTTMLPVVRYRQFCIHVPDADGLMKLTVDERYLETLRRVMLLIPNHHFTLHGRMHPKIREVIGRDLNDDSHGQISRASNLKPIERKAGPIRCSAVEGGALDHNVLLPNGDVVLCCCDYSLKHKIGNLLTDSYEDLFRSTEYQRIKRAQLDDSQEIICRGCEYAVPA